MHLDAGYDPCKAREALKVFGCEWVLSKKSTPLQTGGRWVVVRTNSCHSRGFRKLQICPTRRINVIDAFITTRRPIRKGWNRYR